MQRLNIGLPHALVSGLFFLLLLLYSAKSGLLLHDTDVWWHIRAGDLILRFGGLPAHDIYSFTAGDYPWVNLSWLWDAMYSLAHRWTGMYLPIIFTAATNALTMALLISFLLKRNAGMLLTIATFIICLLPFSYMATPRPHQITFLMTMLFYIITHEAIASGRHRPLAFLPLLMLAWANMHGGFLMGYTIIGAYGLQALVEKNKAAVKALTLAMAGCLLAALITPLGIHIFEACARTLQSAMMPFISEWQPMSLIKEHLWHIVYVVLFLATFRPRNPHVGLAEKLLSLAWCVAAARHERNLPIFVLLSAPVFALNAYYVLSPKWKARVDAKSADYHKDFSQPKVRKVAAVLAFGTLALLLLGAGKPLMILKTPDVHPVEEAQYFKDHYQGLRVLNDYSQGGYLLYTWGESSHIFIDGRAETAYPSPVIQDYIKFMLGKPGWEAMLDTYKIDAALIYKEQQPHAVKYFDGHKHWKKVFDGKLDALYVRKNVKAVKPPS